MSNQLAESIDFFVVYKFIKLLATPFNKTDAFKLGLIDDKGTFLKKRKDFTNEDRKALPRYLVMIFNIKKLINRLPGGENKLKNFGVAMFLLKEEIDANLVDEKDIQAFAEEIELPELKSFAEFISEEEGGGSAPPTVAYTTGSASMDQMTGIKTSSFGKCRVYHVTSKTFNSVKNTKTRYEKFMKYVGEGPLCDDIRSYAKTNPGKSIMIRDDSTGGYAVLKLGSKETW